MGVRWEGGRLVFHQCVERDWGCCCSGWIGRVGEGRWVVVEVVDIFLFYFGGVGGWLVGWWWVGEVATVLIARLAVFAEKRTKETVGRNAVWRERSEDDVIVGDTFFWT